MLREMAQDLQERYVSSPSWKKELIVDLILSTLRAQEPPVRFLKRDAKTGLWNDVGNDEFEKKVKKTLGYSSNNREEAPQERPQDAPPASVALSVVSELYLQTLVAGELTLTFFNVQWNSGNKY
jgi:hypothetical protein